MFLASDHWSNSIPGMRVNLQREWSCIGWRTIDSHDLTFLARRMASSLVGHRKRDLSYHWLLQVRYQHRPSQLRIVASSFVTFVYRSHWVHLYLWKPISLACSLKTLLHIIIPYFLMRPVVWPVTRHARESLPYFLGWECCWWGIFILRESSVY